MPDNFQTSTAQDGCYSMWLMPPHRIHQELGQLIADLGRRFGAPVFPPHVTLLGNLEGREKALSAPAKQLAARLQPFRLTLTTMDYLDDYFRSLFVRAKMTLPLMEANREARRIFHREQDPEFMPHLSLLYGDFNIETKQEIIASIGRDHEAEFQVSALHLFSTTGEPEDWRRAEEIPLAGRQNYHEN